MTDYIKHYSVALVSSMLAECEIDMITADQECYTMISSLEALRTSLRTQVEKVDIALQLLNDVPRHSSFVPAKRFASSTVKMFAFIMHTGDVSLTNIQTYLKTLRDVNSDALRSQLAHATKKGWLLRTRRGVYRVTPLGAVKCGLTYERGHA